MVDIAVIAQKGFTTIRIYGTDCDGLKNVGDACQEHGIKMIVGIFIDGAGLSKAEKQFADIEAWGMFHMVEMLVVGNEAVFNNHVSAGQLASFILDIKAKARACGFTGPVTTTETLGVLENHASVLCDAMDVVGINIQPFFNDDVSASQAGTFVTSQLKIAGELCPGKEVYNLESGWPSAGIAHGAAVPGHAEQKTAIDSILAAAGSHTVFMSFGDDSWKAPGPWMIEGHFGCVDNL